MGISLKFELLLIRNIISRALNLQASTVSLDKQVGFIYVHKI